MNIVITGGLGNISSRLTAILAAEGHTVKVITRDAGKAADISALNAIPLTGSVTDREFVQTAFAGADAVYTMIPPGSSIADLKGMMLEIGENYAQAIAHHGISHVVNLSGIGAHQPRGMGPSSAFWYLEERLNALESANILHLRPGYFYTNLYGNMEMIRQLHLIGNSFNETAPILMTHPHDIAAEAAAALHTRQFSGKNFRYVISDEQNGHAIAGILGNAVGQPNLPWVTFSEDDLLQALTKNGFSQHMATLFLEMGRAIGNGSLWEDYRRQPDNTPGRIKLEAFAAGFASVYQSTGVPA